MKRNIKKIVAIVLTIAIFSYLLYVYFSPPPTDESTHIKCISKTLFNVNCFSCGMTRFVYFAMHGDFISAFQYNILGPFLLITLAVIYVYFARWAFADKAFPNIPIWVVWVFLGIIIIYSVLRNVSVDALRFLVPPS